MRKAFLLMVAVTCMNLSGIDAQVYKTVRVDTAGMLSALLTPEELASVTDLTLTGRINSDDFYSMRNLMPSLTGINLDAVRTDGDSIPGYAFKSAITYLILPSSITLLGNYSLSGCNLLTALVIPPLVKTIGNYAFAGCSGLISVTLPESVTTIGSYAFAGCMGLTLMVIPDAVSSIREYTFVSCSMLDSISIGSSVDTIGENAFAGCNSLTSVTIPSSVTCIARYAFVGCPALTTLNIHCAKKTTIGEYAFASNTGLTSVTFHPSEGISIGTGAFISCTGLKELNMASPSVASIGEACFINTSIDTLVFPSSLTSIGNQAFINNDSLKSLTFLSSPGTTIGETAFVDCSNLGSVTFHPSSGTSIGPKAFLACSALKTLNMASPSVTSIGDECFLYNIIDSLVFPSSLTSLGYHAFYNSDSLKSLTFLPSSGASIGEGAFEHCDQLASVTFHPSSGTSIGKNAFIYCTNLVSLKMDSPSVDSIGDLCFYECRKLSSINLSSSLVYIGYGAFHRTSITGTLPLPSSLTYIGDNAFSNLGITGSLILPSSLKHIGREAFSSCHGLDSLTFLPTSGTYVGEKAFSHCTGLTTLKMHSPSVDSIGVNSFYYCTGLTSVILPSSLVSMKGSSFGYCSGLQNIRINKMTPPVIFDADNIFNNVSTAAVDLYVPAGTKELYQAAEVWSGFNIIEFDLQMSASPDTLAIADTLGSTARFDIASTTSWQVVSGQEWLTVDPVFGMDTAGIMLVAEANPDTVARVAVITVSGENVSSQTVVVTQAPMPALSVSANALETGPFAGSKAQFNIASNQYWTVQSGQIWLSVEPSSGSGNGEIALIAEANPDTTSREAIVTVNTGRLTPQLIVVTQAPRPFLSVSSAMLELGSKEGSTALFNIASNTGWTLLSDQLWLAVSPSSGNGNSEIILTAEANPDTMVREARVTVSGDSVASFTLIVTQEATIPSGFMEDLPETMVIFPNPVKDALHIDNAAGSVMTIFDLQGRIIFSRSLRTHHESIDLSSLSPGDYVIKIGSKTVKIVK